MEDIDAILKELDSALDTKSEAPKAKAKSEKSDKVTKPIEAPGDWYATEFEGVECRMIDARELFEIESLPPVRLLQYRGFESATGVVVPQIPEIYEPCVAALGTLCVALATNMKPMLVGHTGTGKTSLYEFFAAKLGRPFVRVVFDATTDDQKLFGSLELRKGETYFNKSDLTRSMEYPAVVCSDEFSRANAEQTMLMNPVLDRKEIRVTCHDDDSTEVVEAHPHWFIGGTDNTNGTGDDMDLYNSSNVLDEAVRNRFDLYDTVPYPSESIEREIISQLAPDMDAEDVRLLAHFSSLCHKGYVDRKLHTAFSVRNLIAITAMVNIGESITEAIRRNFMTRVSKSEQADVAEMVRANWGS